MYRTNMWKKFFSIALVAFAFLSVARISGAETFRVTTGADDGTGSLRQAILSANANGQANTIDVDSSVKEIKISATIDITGDVTLNGQGATVIGSKVTRLFSVSGGIVKFNRFTFTGGYPLSESGGAFYIDATKGSVDFVNCTFFGNRAGGSGGAVYVYGGGLKATTFTNCSLVNNQAAASGGGVAVFGGVVQFTASIVVGNSASSNADVHVESSGILSNSGQYNVIGQTNAGVFFPSTLNNTVSAVSADIFKTPSQLTTVDGVQVLPLLSATSNIALDLIPSANALALPTVDERGAVRPQILAVDAGAYELSPIALASIDLVGGAYVQKGTSEKYKVLVYPEDATLDVRNYEDGIEWTVVNPPYSEVISVDQYGSVTGLATGQATLRATAHGWNSRGVEMTATDTIGITVGEQPLPAPTVSVTFKGITDDKLEMSQGSQRKLELNLSVAPTDTPYTVLFESDDPVTATVTQSSLVSTTAVLKTTNLGQSLIRVTVTAENSKGKASDYAEFLLTVTEHKSGGGGGGGCNAGWGLMAFAIAGLWLLKGKRR